MQDLVRFSSNEVALGLDLNLLQQATGNALSRIFQGLLAGTANESIGGLGAVIGGFRVTIASPFTQYLISPGVALQGTGASLEFGDYPFEIMQSGLQLTVPAAPPNPLFIRYDVIEIRVKPRTVINQDRLFYDPASGAGGNRTTPKFVVSLPNVRLRTGTTGGDLIDQDWLPLAYVKTYIDGGGVFHFEIDDARPMYRVRTQNQVSAILEGDIASPGLIDGRNSLSCSRGFVLFDDKRWELPPTNAQIRDLMEGGFYQSPDPAIQMLHLYIAKPRTNRFSPDFVQYIVSLKAPTVDGRPSSDLQLRGLAAGHFTSNASYICSFMSEPDDIGSGIVMPRVLPFRKSANGLTLIGEKDSIYHATITCAPSVPRLVINLPNVPPNASTVRISFYLLNTVGYNAVTRLGFATDAGGAGPELNFQKFSVFALTSEYHTITVDAPLNRGPSGPPYLIVVGNFAFSMQYDILGWTHTPNATTSQG